MRLLCFILSVYVIMLTVKPCCADDCRTEQTTKTEQASKLPFKNKECPGCSPFFTCGTCVGFVVAKPFTLDLKLIAESPAKIYADYQQPHVKHVPLSIWQPPQLS